jgi:hypothetical protein
MNCWRGFAMAIMIRQALNRPCFFVRMGKGEFDLEIKDNL